jgi:hypothetical protein
MSTNLSLSERIRNACSSQEVENVKAYHAYWHGRCDFTTEVVEIWSKSEERGWGHAFGCMKGVDQTWYGMVSRYDKTAFDIWLATIDTYPEIGGKDPRPLRECSVHMLVCDIIEVAEDGQSARGMFITPGVIHSVLSPQEQKRCLVIWERYGSDFVFEDGRWRYLNEQCCPDILTMLDNENWSADEYANITSENPAPPPDEGLVDFPPVAFPGTHMIYSIRRAPQNSVPWPEPYQTLDQEHRYNQPPSGLTPNSQTNNSPSGGQP